jgi:hypothetical protein
MCSKLDKIKKARTTVRYLDFGDFLFPVDRIGTFQLVKNMTIYSLNRRKMSVVVMN